MLQDSITTRQKSQLPIGFHLSHQGPEARGDKKTQTRFYDGVPLVETTKYVGGVAGGDAATSSEE